MDRRDQGGPARTPAPGADAAETLARDFQEGDPTAFEGLVDAFQERFYRVAYRVLGDPDEALDVVQDAFVKIHGQIGSWDGDSRFASWAFRVVTNLAIDGLRRRGRERKACEQRAQELPDHEADRAGDGLVAEETVELVALRHYEGFSLKEIAEIRGCALGTVKSTLHQAFRNLRQSLGDDVLEAAGANGIGGKA